LKFLNFKNQEKKRKFFIYLTILVGLILVIYTQPFLTSYFVKGDVQEQSGSEVENMLQELTDVGNKYNNCINEKSSFNDRISKCESERIISESRLSDYKDKYDECNIGIKDVRRKLESAEEDLRDCKDDCDTERLRGDLSVCNSNLKNCENDLDDCSEKDNDFDLLAKNAAKIICCTKKIYDNSIDSYVVEGNAIKCVVGGENRISCF